MSSFIQMQSERMAERRRQLQQSTPPSQPTKLTKQLLHDLYAATLAHWWNSMAPAVRQHPWSMDTILTAAFPSENPAPRFVAKALRDTLHFTEKRDWTVAGRNRRQWHPPV